MVTTVCLGCGAKHLTATECATCHARLVRCLDVFKHWPLETSLSPAALLHVRNAVSFYMAHRMQRDSGPNGPVENERINGELDSLKAHINAYLQHVTRGLDAFTFEPTDEELLS